MAENLYKLIEKARETASTADAKQYGVEIAIVTNVQDPDQLGRALTEKLLVYATGGAPSIADRSEIEAIVRAVQPKNYGFRSLVHEIVQSPLFQQK